MKKIAIFIPIKSNSTRLPNKNFKYIGGVPLYTHTLNLAESLLSIKDLDLTIIVDTDSELIKSESVKCGLQVMDRLPALTKDDASGDDLLRHHVKTHPNFDLYCQMYVTSPFQTSDSIKRLLHGVLKDDEYDSGFLAHTKQTWFWFNNKPINYTPGKLIRSQDSVPVVMETTGFYCIKKEAWVKTNSRVGESPLMYPVSFKESIDIDTEEDYNLAALLCNCVI